jgi:hypothetical protein
MGFVVLNRKEVGRGRAVSLWVCVAALGFVFGFVLGCAAVVPAPPVEHHSMKVPKGSLQKIAVLAFQPSASLIRARAGEEESAETIADLVARLMTDELMKRGIEVIGPSDLETALIAQGARSDRVDRRVAARLAAQDFGATAILFGEVSRWRERDGEKYGSSSPASVAFKMGIYSAPDMRRLWTSKFDETQRALSEHVLNVRRYPGGGSRWLKATELAQWGVKSAVDTIPNM